MNNKLKVLAFSVASLSAAQALAIDFKVSGQLNRAVMSVDNGESSDTFFVDNTNSSSRFRFTGAGEVAEGIEMGFNYEMEFESEPSVLVNEANSGSTTNELQERLTEVYLKGGLGQVNLGQGNGAANGLTHVTLAGTAVASLLAHYSMIGGGVQFQENGVASGTSVRNAFAELDFESRYDRVAYTTPKFGSFNLVASAGRKSDMIYEVAIKQGAQYGFGKVAAGIGFSQEKVSGADDNETFGGSAAILLNSGFNAAISYSQLSDRSDKDAKNMAIQIGYKFGNHATAVDYGITEDRNMKGDDGNVISLSYVYTPVPWAELYVSGRQFSLDRAGTDYDNVVALLAGSRIKF